MMTIWRRSFSSLGAALPAFVFLVGLCLAAAGGLWLQYKINNEAAAEFERGVQRVTANITQRFRQPVYGLNGAKGMYAASQSVERAEFLAYVEARDLPKEFPGVRGFGFVQHVMRSELDAFIAAERADGAPQFAIRQFEDNSHKDLYVLKFMEPAANNVGAMGLDIGSETARRSAAQRAVDTGEPTITAAIRLVQDSGNTPGVLVYVPVYAKGSNPTNADERRAALVGLVDAPIVIAELLDTVPDVVSKRWDFDLIDSAPGSPGGTLLYDADNHAAELANPLAPPEGRRFSSNQSLLLLGRELTLRVNSTPEFDATIEHATPWLVFAAGAIASGLLAMLLRQQATGRRRAEGMARRMTRQLRLDKERSSDFSKSASDWFWETDAQHCFCYFSDNFEQVYGLAPGQLLGKSRKKMVELDELNPPEAIKPHVAQLEAHLPFKNFECQIRLDDGSTSWNAVSGLPYVDVDGRFAGYRGTGTLVTERKQAEADLRIAATAFESQVGMTITNTDHVILRVNKSFTEITGYTVQEAVGQTPRLLSSGRHDGAFYAAMWRRIALAGSWQGEIWNRRKNGEVYPEWLNISAVKDDAGRVTHYVGSFSDITDRKTAQDKIQNLAFYDPLTLLPNRRLLMDRLQHALAMSFRHQCNGALLFIDLDDFKTINDTLGHASGDMLLEQVAKRLGTCVRDSDTLARLGGDEFVVILEELCKNTEEAVTYAERMGEKILATLNHNYQLGGGEHRRTASIGITLFGDQQENLEEPLKRADLAMYQAKAAGRNTLRFYEPQMQAVVIARAALEAELREAVLKSQFLLHYQAQIGDARQITGVEALVRWQDPRRGLVSPAEFIPLAEETGLILPLGHWVLETACTQLALWAKQPQMAHLTMAVNVSARQFHQRDFVTQVLDTLERTGAKPERLKLELTESLLVVNVEDVIAKMSALKRKGVGFSLDDFGTGYSSLSYLKRLPLDQLKIDQGFVRDILTDHNDAAIAKMVVALAESMGLAVIAEGVEIEAQRDFLAGLGCHAYQGYLFSRPLPLDEFETLLQRV